ncbi:MAG TPA: hypothetical protein VIC84_07040, partial [Blastocatellia bacterium]
MTRSKYFAGCCAVSGSVLFFWTLLIGACSRNHVAPAQSDKAAAISQSFPTPDAAAKAAASPQGAATPAPVDATTALKDCSQSKKLLRRMNEMKMDKDSFYQYAVRLFNQPIACKGETNHNQDGDYELIVFSFANGATYKMVASPPETSLDKFLAPGGFPNEEEARSFVKQYSEKVGLHIDWSKPEEST